MQAIKRKEENRFSGVVKKLLLFSFFCISFSILVFAVISAVAVKIPAIESYFGILTFVLVALVVMLVSLVFNKKSDKPLFDALSCGSFFSFVLFAVSLICGSGASMPTLLLRLVLIPAVSVLGAILSRLSGTKKRKRRAGKSRVNVSRKKY